MIESFLTAFAFGTVWFWILAVIASVIIIACTEHEHYPTPSIVVTLLAIIYWKQIIAAPWQTIGIVVGLFALFGVLWSIFKWFRHVNKFVAKYRSEHGIAQPDGTVTLSESQMRDLRNDISVSNNKALLTGWIAFWPWSLLWSLTGDFFNMLYDAMSNVYQKITDSGLNKFKVEPEKVVVNEGENYRRGR